MIISQHTVCYRMHFSFEDVVCHLLQMLNIRGENSILFKVICVPANTKRSAAEVEL